LGLLSASIKVAILPKSLDPGPWTQGVGVDSDDGCTLAIVVLVMF